MTTPPPPQPITRVDYLRRMPTGGTAYKAEQRTTHNEHRDPVSELGERIEDAALLHAGRSIGTIASSKIAADLIAAGWRKQGAADDGGVTISDLLKKRLEQVVAQRDEARHECDSLQARIDKVAEFCAERAQYITAIENCAPSNDRDYYRWQGHAEARRQLSQRLELPVGWPTLVSQPQPAPVPQDAHQHASEHASEHAAPAPSHPTPEDQENRNA